MKRYLKNDLIFAEDYLNKCNSPEEIHDSKNTINHINALLDFLENKSTLIIRERHASIVDFKINKAIYDIIFELINIYSGMDLLGEGNSVDYPRLMKLNFTDQQIIKVLTYIYNNEFSKTNITTILKNIRFFNINTLKKLFNDKGKCVIYHNFIREKTELLCERVDTIHDVLNPTTNFIELLPEFDKQHDNNTHLMKYFMKYRCIQHLSDKTILGMEAQKLSLIDIDTLIYDSKRLKKLSSNSYDQLSIEEKFCLLNFLDKIIAMFLVENTPLTAKDLVNKKNEIISDCIKKDKVKILSMADNHKNVIS